MEKKKIVKMLDELCCSDCHASFDENSVDIVRKEENLYVVKIICSNCQKSFGLAMLGINSIEFKDEIKQTKFTDEDLKFMLDVEDTPISYDDVLDAHEYIKNIDEHWQNFIKEKNL